MADKKIVAATLQVDTEAAQRNVLNLNNKIADLKKELKETAAGSDEQFAAFKKLKAAQDELGTATKKLNDLSKETTGHFSNIKEGLNNVHPALGKASEGVGKLGSSFKALLANPVVLILAAIVAALALLYKAFTNTLAGAQKVEQIFSGIKAAGQALIDNLGSIASAIKNVFTFNFSGAVKDIEQVTGAAKKAYSEMSKLTAEAQKLKREQSQNDLDQIERQAKLADLREKAADETIPIKERIRLGKELLAESERNAIEDMDLAKRTAANKIAALTLEKDGENKNLEEINQIKGEQRRGEIENTNELRRIRKTITQAEKQEDSERKAIEKEAEDRRKETLQKQKEHAAEEKRLLSERLKNEAEYWKARKEKRDRDIADIEGYGAQLAAADAKLDAQKKALAEKNVKDELETRKKLAQLDGLDNPTDPAKKIELVKANLALELNALADGDIQKQILVKQSEDAITQIKKDAAEAQKQIDELATAHKKAQLDEVAIAVMNLGNVIGKQTIAGKAIGIATALINTYQGASEAIKQKSTLPSPFDVIAKVANVAAIIGMGLKTVKAITAVQVPGGGGGGGGYSAPSINAPSAPLAPQARSTALDQNSINQLGSAVAPVRAFVIESDVENNRSRVERLNRAAKLGG